MSVEREYDEAYWRAGVAHKALKVIDDAIRSLKLQRRALEAEVHVQNAAFADFVIAHPEVKQINERRAAEHREALGVATTTPGAEREGQ